MRLQQYELIRPIGHGGMGLVFEGRKLSPIKNEDGEHSHETVAIKIIPRREIQIEDQHAQALFEREAVISWRISGEHPNLVTTYDYGLSSQGYRYLVMALIDGVSLSELMLGHARLPFPVIRRIALDVLCGLAYLHQRKVVHRDVTSANVLIDRKGIVRVTDFGLIKPAFQPGSDLFRGTARYAAPEAFNKVPLGPIADLYSLGVLLYRMVAGRYPYGDDFDQVVDSIQSHKPSPPVPGETPDDLARVIAGLISLQPSNRRWTRANDVIEFFADWNLPVALEAEIAQVVEMRSPAAERESAPASLPELGWPFAEPETQPQAPVPSAPPRKDNQLRRWLPWALLPVTFVVGGLAVFGLVQDQLQDERSVNAVAIEASPEDVPPAQSEPTTQPTADWTNEAPSEAPQTSVVKQITADPHRAEPPGLEKAATPQVSKRKSDKKPRSRFMRRSYRKRSMKPRNY